jgi:MFS family permease
MTGIRHSLAHIQKLPWAFWVVIASTLTNQVGNMALAFLVVYLKIHLHYSLPKASIVYAACCGGMLVSGSIAGPLADRYGPQRVMAIVLFLNAAVLLCIPFVQHFLYVTILCIFWGIFFGMYKPAAQTFIAHISPPESYKITFCTFFSNHILF